MRVHVLRQISASRVVLDFFFNVSDFSQLNDLATQKHISGSSETFAKWLLIHRGVPLKAWISPKLKWARKWLWLMAINQGKIWCLGEKDTESQIQCRNTCLFFEIWTMCSNSVRLKLCSVSCWFTFRTTINRVCTEQPYEQTHWLKLKDIHDSRWY